MGENKAITVQFGFAFFFSLSHSHYSAVCMDKSKDKLESIPFRKFVTKREREIRKE